ncbi:peptidoglycan D,D-transpeptidase FtsI family protein [Cohnella thailandensis]|uniref:Penicillin-binding protein 2 n=1 Tax=Cohnella thailandensis TaxID=557557 RepID=A0A841SVJ6_9BACL|nr:penicillin-binding transpeptidase domain-containing protein [Cohnella thailandensis]MBB6632721.1 penicillin-binding protein 2 [Cohnella thailandensis]MBP1975590.1 penicillin-binding protein 2 [Cohnella thailandensis]
MSDPKTEEAQKREIRIRRNFSFRLNLFFFVTFGLFSLLIVRLAFLQFVEAAELKDRKSTQGTAGGSIPPIRGNIYDSEGKPIAYSTSTQSLYFTLGSKSEDEVKRLAERLIDVFEKFGDSAAPEITEEKLLERMDVKSRKNYSYQQRQLKTGLTSAEIAYLSEHRDEYPGIEIVEESIRQYSDDKVAVQLIGYLNKMKGAKENLDFYKKINENQTDRTLKYLDEEYVGYDGLELMYQAELRGLNGYKSYQVDNQSRIIGDMKLTKPVKGQNLHLTINRKVQLVTQQAIMDQIDSIRQSTTKAEKDAEPTTGYAVAMEVDTGKVVAMASMPDYDPNIWQGGITTPELKQITPFMGNGTIREVYPPYENDKERAQHPTSLVPLGSTQKPLTILVGLAEKLITPTSKWKDPGYFPFGAKGHETEIQNASRAANGELTPSKAIAKSSNAFMAANVGNALYLRDKKAGVEVWDSYMKQFGLGVKTESGLPKESPGIIEYFNKESGSAQAALIFASFGQQGKYTTLQLAQYAAMLANRGQRMKPLFVDHITDSEGRVVSASEPEVLNTVDLPDAYWETIEEGMGAVQVQGFEGVSYSFRRKTGTSQQQGVGKRKFVENAVFIAYAPADKPKLAVAVVVPDGGYGGWGAAPIARKIFDAYDAEIGLTTKKN